MKNSFPVAVVYFTLSGKKTAEEIATYLQAQIIDCSKNGENSAKLLPSLFKKNSAIIGVCATGILLRFLAPLINNKHDEPPVIAVSGDGKFIVPLLGGHNGANALAKIIAAKTGGQAAITTASETAFAFSLDEPPEGYILADLKGDEGGNRAKSAMAAILNGEALQIAGNSAGNGDWLQQAGYKISPVGSVKIVVSEFVDAKNKAGEYLHYFPKNLVAGMGCARGAEASEIISLLEKTLAAASLSPNSLAAIATIDIKSDEEGLHQAAAYFGVPLKLFSPDELGKKAKQVPNPSLVVKAETGTASVAEAAALFAGKLVVEKQKTTNATCAIGCAENPVDLTGFGKNPGQLHLVGIGPGESKQRTKSATDALKTSDHWVGYSLYLDLVGDLQNNQKLHSFDLGDEEKRVRFAMELAAKGNNVALVCSGDAQIYAMASLVFELMLAKGKRAVSASAKRLEVTSHPGISALQMASSRAGALLGHDFCAISLSDLLTPRTDIEKRLLAAAEADFVTAFYNPRSRRRVELIAKAKQLFLQHRPPDTPVIIASNLGRDKESVRIVALEKFDPEEIDMLTIVLFGSSNSVSFSRGNGKNTAFTPRGYANKISGE